MAAQTQPDKIQQLLNEAYEKGKAKVAVVNRKLAEADANRKHLILTAAATVEIAGTAYAFGYVRAYYGEKRFLNLPAEAWAAILFHGVGLYFDLTAKSGAEGELARIVGAQFHNVANGALAAYAHTLGAEMGAKKLQEKQGQPQPASAGLLTGAPMHQLPEGTRMPLSAHDLNTVAANI